MLKFDTAKGCLESLSTTNLIDESLLERYDLQAAIIASWDAFCAELGMGHLYYIASEVVPHPSCRDSIDILALDWEGAPVVIELKRARNKLQMLQALTYAAMIATWSHEDYANRVVNRTDADDIRSLLDSLEDMPDPRIVLVAEDYDPEVILTADFLHNRDIDVTAVAIQLVKHNNDLLMSINRRYPLVGLEETYTARGPAARKQISSEEEEVTWEDVANQSKLSWAQTVIDGLQRRGFGDGNPKCRFFGAKRNTTLGDMATVCFRSDNVLVHIYGQTSEKEAFLKSKLGLPLEPWGRSGDRRSGWGFRIRTLEDLNTFFAVIDGRS
jgi:hypothetical protein